MSQLGVDIRRLLGWIPSPLLRAKVSSTDPGALGVPSVHQFLPNSGVQPMLLKDPEHNPPAPQTPHPRALSHPSTVLSCSKPSSSLSKTQIPSNHYKPPGPIPSYSPGLLLPWPCEPAVPNSPGPRRCPRPASTFSWPLSPV